MRGLVLTLALALAGVCVLAGVSADASPQSDFDAVYGDWRGDRAVTPCRWTQAKLESAYKVATGNPDFQYETAFQDNVRAEINRWRSGGCAGVAPLSQRRRSPLYGVRVMKLSGSGTAAKEFARVANRTKKTVAFRKASLRNLTGGKSLFPATFKLKAGKVALVRVGCAPGRRHASFAGTRVWLCRRSQLLRDRGDVARLADAKGVVVSQRGFGTQKRRPVY
jgi:hypothetical protein